jgi:predicted ATPase
VRRDLPSGTVTFLFTDVEGSTRLLHELGSQGYADALLEHRRLLRDTFTRHGGVEVDTQGDALFVAFPTATGAVAAAREGQAALRGTRIRVRMGLHSGTPHLSPEGYVGEDVHKGARIAAVGHGGQVLLSGETREHAGTDVTDLGEHRLKDFDQPVCIYQLGSERFPPLKTISNTNLPRPASSFVGRTAEVDDVVGLVRHGARLLTLTGPGGSGKTRLAIEAASELVPDFKAGAFWVPMATLREPALVIPTITQTLGAADGLAAHIGDREMLLLLDNVEQVVDAAPDLAALVESCRHLTLVVTSRELLHVRGEVDYPVLPLADPDALALFCARAGTDPDQTVHDLCRALDNLPLALELAAARANVLTPRQMLDRLSQRLDLLRGGRDADPRQQTLRATIEWSYDLLGDDQRRLFARLAVFRGGCTLEVAEDVVDADLDVLQPLVDKSLLRHTGERFWMLETIREYAVERLDASGEADDLRRRHAEWCLALAEEALPHLTSSPREWLDRLEAEHDNLRAAIDRLEAAGETQLVIQLTGALQRFWYQRGHLAEGRRRIESALAADSSPTPARARALNGAAMFAVNTGDAATAESRALEARALHGQLGDEWGAAYAVFLLGAVAMERGDHARALELCRHSLDAFRRLGDDHFSLLAADGMAWMHGALGDDESRRQLHEEILVQARAQSNERVVALTLGQLAYFARDEGRYDDALDMLAESLRIRRALTDHRAMAEDLCRLARVLATAGRAQLAVRVLSCAETLREQVGATTLAWVGDTNEETRALCQAQLDESAFATEWVRGRSLDPDDAAALATAAGGATAG